jgi:hypothetical protein
MKSTEFISSFRIQGDKVCQVDDGRYGAVAVPNRVPGLRSVANAGFCFMASQSLGRQLLPVC